MAYYSLLQFFALPFETLCKKEQTKDKKSGHWVPNESWQQNMPVCLLCQETVVVYNQEYKNQEYKNTKQEYKILRRFNTHANYASKYCSQLKNWRYCSEAGGKFTDFS